MRMIRRLEESDEGRTRIEKAKERLEEYLTTQGPKDEDGENEAKPDEFDIAENSPKKSDNGMDDSEGLEEGPNTFAESRHPSPSKDMDTGDGPTPSQTLVHAGESDAAPSSSSGSGINPRSLAW